MGLSATEQLHKSGLETLVQQPELLRENAGHLPGDPGDDALQILFGLLHVVPLAGEIGVAGVDPVKFLNGPDVDIAQRADLPLQLADPAAGLGDALQFNPLGSSVGVAQFIVFPQPVQNLLFLHGGGGNFLLQFGG